MASEDSVENDFSRYSSVLAIPIDGVRKLDELHKPFDGAVAAIDNSVNRGGEDLIVLHARRKAHVAAEERHHNCVQDASIIDLQHQHVWIARLRKD